MAGAVDAWADKKVPVREHVEEAEDWKVSGWHWVQRVNGVRL